MLAIIRKMIVDNLMQKEIEFIVRVRKFRVCLQTGSGISAHAHLSSLCVAAHVRKISHTQTWTEERSLI